MLDANMTASLMSGARIQSNDVPNQGAAANRGPPGQLGGSDNLSAIVAAARAFPAAVAELGRYPAEAGNFFVREVSKDGAANRGARGGARRLNG